MANQIWTNLQMEDYQLTIWKKQTTHNMAIFNLYLNQESGLHRQTSSTRMQWKFQLEWARIAAQIKVNQTGGNRSGLTGNRSNRSGPVPVWSGTKPAQIQNLNLNSKKVKNSQKIS